MSSSTWVRDVTGLAVGDHVVLSYNSCGACDNCGSGLPMHCRDFVGLNMVGARLDGTSPFSHDGTPILGHFFGQSSWATRVVTTDRTASRSTTISRWSCWDRSAAVSKPAPARS